MQVEFYVSSFKKLKFCQCLSYIHHLALEKIDVSYDGTPREPILERIAPGVNVKDVRTWVFYFSIRGKRHFSKPNADRLL